MCFYVFWEGPRVDKRGTDEEAEGPEVEYQITQPVIRKVVLGIFLWGYRGVPRGQSGNKQLWQSRESR
jgi:hypothetical protein